MVRATALVPVKAQGTGLDSVPEQGSEQVRARVKEPVMEQGSEQVRARAMVQDLVRD